MRVGCVFVSRFALAVEQARRLPLGGGPGDGVGVVGGGGAADGGRVVGGVAGGGGGAGYPATVVYLKQRVLEASPELMDAWAGRALRQARALYPRAVYVPADPARYAEAAAAMSRALELVAAEVESGEQGVVYVGVSGMERLFAGVHGSQFSVHSDRGRAKGGEQHTAESKGQRAGLASTSDAENDGGGGRTRFFAALRMTGGQSPSAGGQPLPTGSQPLPTTDQPLPTTDQPPPITDHLQPTIEEVIGGALVEAVREATGLVASVGIGSGKFVARVGAQLSRAGSVVVIGEGDERRFLRDASVGVLPFEPEIAVRLRSLGLHTLGEVAALPRPAVEAQFRSIGGRMWELANGIDETPLVAGRTPEAISERLTFESPVVTSEALVMAARQVVRRLSVRLGHRAARKMHAQVLSEGRLVWDRTETFRDATADEGRMVRILKTRLESLQLTEAVDTVAVTLSEIVREPGRQGKLITETNPQLERLLEAVQEIRARFGGPMVWRAVEVDPCSRHPEERAMLIPYDA